MQQFYFIILNPSKQLGGGGGGGCTPPPPWTLKFHIWYEVETYIRDTPAKMMTIGDVQSLNTALQQSHVF